MAKAKRGRKSFGDELREAIRNSGMTHYAIACKAGFRDKTPGALSPDRIDRFVSGERDPQLSTIEKIIDALGLRVTLVED